MKHLIIRTLVFCALTAAAAFAATTPALAQTQTDGNEPITVDGCRPLLAPDCVVDDIVEEVNVGSAKADYSTVLDDNLTNYATLPSLAKVSALHDVIISIRDLKHKYKGGQKVGFVIGGDGSLLNLSVLEGLSIMFFNDNVQVGDAISISADNFSVVSLNLLSTSGSRTISVDAPEGIIFDEIMLCSSGVADISALSNMNVFYGFVGGVETKLQNQGGENTYTSEHMPYSVFLGPVYNWKVDDFANGDTYNPLEEFALTDLVANDGFGLRITKNDGYGPDNVEIGFTYKSTKILDASLLNNIYIKLEDTNNSSEEEVEGVNKFTLKQSILGLDALGSVEARYSAFIPKGVKWNRVTLRLAGVSLLNVLKGTEVYYAYIKKFDIPEEAERCDLNLSADALICASEPSYTLTSDEKVTWALTEAKDHENNDITNSSDVTIAPTNAEKSATVTFGTSPAGVYTFTATHDHGDGTSCTGTVTITRGKTDEMTDAMASSFCGTPLDASLDGVDLTKESDGGLLVIDGLENADNIIDGDLNSYASYARGVQLAANTCIAGVKKRSGKFDKDGVNGVKVVGFVAETPSGLLGADVLTFYRIVLYNKGKEVYSSVTDNNNAVSASLIGAPGSGMVRYAVTVPDDVKEFDEFALVTSGVLNLDLQGKTMKIYNAFTSADPGCATAPAGSPLGRLGVTPINLDATGARINYSQTGGSKFDLVTAVSTTTGLGYLISNDVTALGDDPKGVVTNVVANVLAPSKLAVKTGRVFDKGRWVGLVMKVPAGLASIDVLDLGMKIGTYYKGLSTGDEAGTDVGLLRANLLGYGDYVYLSVYANHKFDEVRFEKGELASVLSTTQYLGFYTYADADGDGIPDEEDPDFCEEPIVVEIEPSLVTDINSLCEGRDGEGLKATVKAESTTGLTYNITDTDRKKIVASGTVGKDVININFGSLSLGYGRYEFRVSDRVNPLTASAKAKFTIHAAQTTWNPQIEVDEESTAAEGGEDDAALYRYSTDWNKWENWTQGVPVIGCSDVIIPGDNMHSFPVLEAYSGSDKPKDFNSCENIHFMAGAEVQGTEKLDYEYASVDFNLASGRYYMLSTPLKATYAGDFFIPADMNGSQSNDLFEKLNEKTSPENRFSPRVYQRLWMQSAPVTTGEKGDNDNVTGGTGKVQYDETRWTPPFNGLTQQYGFEQAFNTQPYQEAEDEHSSYSITGFSLKADAEDLPVTTLKFRLPKEHTTYYYYNEKNQQTDLYETIDRKKDAGRLYTDYLTGYLKDKGDNWKFPIILTTKASSTVFIAGNPFMAHINIAKFFENNKDIDIKEVKVYDGNAMNSAVLCDGELLTNNNGKTKEWTSIAPMQSFFVTVGSETKSCKITYTEDMLETQPNGAQQLRIGRSRAAKAESEGDRLTITASTGDVESNALVRFSGDASADFVPGEDAALLVDNEVRPRVQVFTIAGNRAADIQQTPQTDRITLGFMLAETAPLTLSLSGDTDWNLYDTLTGATYSLAGGQAVSLGTAGSSTGRYMLVRPATDISTVAPAQGIAIRRTPQGTVTITSADGTALGECAVYSADGTLTGRTNGGTTEVELNAAPGISIVKATKADGTTFTQKIY